MRKETYSIKRPGHLVIGDPWYFESIDSKRLRNLVIDIKPPKEFEAALSIQETEYGECEVDIVFSFKKTIDTYLAGYYYEGQKDKIKKLPVDTAEYSIQVDGHKANIHTYEDGYWGQEVIFYTEDKTRGKKYLEAYRITINTPDGMEFEEVEKLLGSVFEDMKLIPQKEKQKSTNELKR